MLTTRARRRSFALIAPAILWAGFDEVDASSITPPIADPPWIRVPSA
jgi:hypothetical protein